MIDTLSIFLIYIMMIAGISFIVTSMVWLVKTIEDWRNEDE